MIKNVKRKIQMIVELMAIHVVIKQLKLFMKMKMVNGVFKMVMNGV